MSDDPKDGYDVGYGKPPKDHQFKKGQPSANPNGRPKKDASVVKALEVLLGEDLVVGSQDGSKTSMPANEVIAKKMINQAASGNIQTQKMIVQLEKRMASTVAIPEKDPEKEAKELALKKRVMDAYMAAIHDKSAARHSGLFELDENDRLAPSRLGQPIQELYSDLSGSKIRSADEYRVRQRECINRLVAALQDHAFEHIQIWDRSLQKSDLE